jgi:hypothetical protein
MMSYHHVWVNQICNPLFWTQALISSCYINISPMYNLVDNYDGQTLCVPDGPCRLSTELRFGDGSYSFLWQPERVMYQTMSHNCFISLSRSGFKSKATQ